MREAAWRRPARLVVSAGSQVGDLEGRVWPWWMVASRQREHGDLDHGALAGEDHVPRDGLGARDICAKAATERSEGLVACAREWERKGLGGARRWEAPRAHHKYCGYCATPRAAVGGRSPQLAIAHRTFLCAREQHARERDHASSAGRARALGAAARGVSIGVRTTWASEFKIEAAQAPTPATTASRAPLSIARPLVAVLRQHLKVAGKPGW